MIRTSHFIILTRISALLSIIISQHPQATTTPPVGGKRKSAQKVQMGDGKIIISLGGTVEVGGVARKRADETPEVGAPMFLRKTVAAMIAEESGSGSALLE